jgi:plasmid maintenance system antidote protein VapI
MNTFADFCEWMGSQKRAAKALDLSESTVSRIKNGKAEITPTLAERVEAVSHGRFRKEALIWPDAANDS